MSQAECLLLPDVRNVNHVRDLAYDFQQVSFLAFLEHLLELVAHVEMIFDRLFATSCDDDDLVAAGRQRFLDAVLDDWFIHQRQHFLGLRLCGG